MEKPSPEARRVTVYGMAWPTTRNPRTEFVTLRLTADEAASLDAYASARSLSRSAAVREAVEMAVSPATPPAAPPAATPEDEE